ncbi:hypothetical protein GCM10023168_30270 [Fodinibacter luteus]|uniref:2TM domain-containing protein n=1 Tax=Fodinibacter luteus TaxID=552064 RepID=A0ABP8KLY3_9MICO
MNPRLRKTVTSNVFWLAFLIIVGLFVLDGSERTSWFLVWVPLAVLISVLMDYFVWNRSGRDQRLQQDRDRPRYGE